VGSALDLEDYHPSVLLDCWLGHLTCKIVSEMTYNVSSGTLNPTKPYSVEEILIVKLSWHVMQMMEVVHGIGRNETCMTDIGTEDFTVLSEPFRILAWESWSNASYFADSTMNRIVSLDDLPWLWSL